jgi:oxygen-independent coproporphyrinogen-3 oxidase
MIDGNAILAKFPASIPRYTSYPTAPHFQKGAGIEIAGPGLAALTPESAVSLYMHVPYCDRLCWFCGCHTRHTLKYEPVQTYLGFLRREVKQVGQRIGCRPLVRQLHLGGGSPSMVAADDFLRLREALHEAFRFDAETEISVEIDPSDVTDATLKGLRDFGITRASIGVQDFDPVVQRAINRPQSFEDTAKVAGKLRDLGIHSLNIDALYGLPKQSQERVAATIAQVIALKPDRVALFGYAHVPWLKKHQQMIHDEDLPGSEARFAHAQMAAAMLCDSGYQRIGMDHFALPGDSLCKASEAGRLHRNFQGYTTDDCDTLIGFGASAISHYPAGYVQNIVPTAQYQAAVERGELAVQAGLLLTGDDHVRAWMIERLMCDFEISYSALTQRFGAESQPYVAEARQIASAEADGLCGSDDQRFFVPAEARPFVRMVASRFDAYLADQRFKFSKAV